MKNIAFFIMLLALTSCSKRFIQEVNPNTKTKFGFEVSAPSKAVYFVTNQKIPASEHNVNLHQKIANSLYNKYGPATDNFFIASTNAKDVKFNLGEKTYYIDVEQLPKRTAMILFDGRHKPKVEFNPEKYGKLVSKIKLETRNKYSQLKSVLKYFKIN